MSNEKIYYYATGETNFGPFTIDELKDKEIDPGTLIWYPGLPGWTAASELEAMRPVLELRPPPINDHKSEGISSSVENNTNNSRTKPELKKASEGWMIAGFVFAILGGYFGIVIGLNYLFGRYNKNTKWLGLLMILLAGFSFGIWRSFR